MSGPGGFGGRTYSITTEYFLPRGSRVLSNLYLSLSLIQTRA